MLRRALSVIFSKSIIISLSYTSDEYRAMGARSYTFGRRRNDWNQREKVDENSGKKITWFKSRGSGPEASVIGRGSGDGTHVIYNFAESVAEGAQSYFT